MRLRHRFAFPASHNYNDHIDYPDEREGEIPMASQNWTIAEAKAKFSEVVDRALGEGPQTITRRGRTAAVVVGAEEWQRKTQRKGTLADFFAASPLREGGLKLPRRTRPRKVDL